MRLLLVSTFAFPDHFGGAERVITDLAGRLVGRGHQVTLLTGQLGDSARSEERDGVQVLRYPLRIGTPGRFYRSVWSGVRGALARGVGADAEVLSVHQVLSAAAALAPGGCRCPARLCSFYAPYHLEYLARHRDGRDAGPVPLGAALVARVLARADRYVLRRCDEVLVLSEYSRRQVADLDPASLAHTTVAPAGVDLQRFRPAADDDERRACARALGLPDRDEPLLLSVRRLVPRMGLTDLLEACATLRGKGRRLHLAIAGDGEQRQALRRRAEALGLEAAVTFLGRLPDEQLPTLYRAASVFVLPTRSLEGFGMVTAEALACGLPVVATEAGASAEVLHGVAGATLVPAARPQALADALDEWLADPRARAAAAAAARSQACARLSWDGHLDAFEAAAERLAGQGS